MERPTESVFSPEQKRELREWSKLSVAGRKCSPGHSCSWCHHTTIHNRRVAPIALVDWHKYHDHGICIDCSVEQVREARERAAAKLAEVANG